MLTETKFGIAAAGSAGATLGAYEWAPHVDFFQHNEMLLHDTQIGLLALTLALAATTVGIRTYKNLPFQDDQSITLIKPSRIGAQREVSRLQKNRRRTWLRRLTGF